MSNRKKSRKLLLITTVLTIVALALVLSVYAVVQLGTITGGTVTVGGVTTGTIYYSNDNSTNWSTSLSPSGPWYAELNFNAGYAGPVTITWQLESDTSGTWTPISGDTVTTTGVILTGSAGQIVYASPNGAQTGNQNWATFATGAGAYRLTATVNSAS